MAAAHVGPCVGSWYPEQESRLNGLLDELFDASRRRTGAYLTPGALAFVVPHAAPCYSGLVAAAAYRHLRAANPRRVFLLGFCHRGGRRGVAIPEVESYRTPLGDIFVDAAAARALCAFAPFRLADEGEVCDHSVEIQLPFLQRAAPSAGVVPLYVGAMDEQQRANAAQALASVWRPGDILLASSDLTHYGRDYHYVPFPVDRAIAARLRQLDGSAIDAAGSLDSGLFLELLRASGATACGGHPIALLLRTLECIGGDVYQQELDYQTSGEITGDFQASVSYAALGYFPRSAFELSDAERRELLASSRGTLHHLVETGRREIVAPGSLPALDRRAPVFVSLHHDGGLLGCIGRVTDCPPLSVAVPEMTLAAALDDTRRPRHVPVPADAEIEISVLTPMKLVRGVEAIRIGIDGVHVACGRSSGLLLPQVAREGWNAFQFLDLTFRKAGLSPRAYHDPQRRISTFQAQVFPGS